MMASLVLKYIPFSHIYMVLDVTEKMLPFLGMSAIRHQSTKHCGEARYQLVGNGEIRRFPYLCSLLKEVSVAPQTWNYSLANIPLSVWVLGGRKYHFHT